MSQNSKKALDFLKAPGPRAQGRPKASLVSRDRAFDLPALAVDAAMEAPFHLPAVFGDGPLSGVAFARRDNRRADPKGLAAKDMVVFRVVGSVGQDAVEADELRRIPHGGRELRRVLGRTSADKGSGQKMSLAVADQRQLGKVAPGVSFALAPDVIAADMSALQAGGVDNAFGPLSDEL